MRFLRPVLLHTVTRLLRSVVPVQTRPAVASAQPPLPRRVALFIDGENTSVGLADQMMQIAGQCGHLTERRVFANWSLAANHAWIQAVARYDLRPVHHERVAASKNAIDILLTVAAMDLIHAGQIDCFCLAASDSDYTPLVKRLRAAGVEVVVMGTSKTPTALREAGSRFVLLERAEPAPGPLPDQVATATRDGAPLPTGQPPTINAPAPPPAAPPPAANAPAPPSALPQTAASIAATSAVASPAAPARETVPDPSLKTAAYWLAKAIRAAPKRDGDWVSVAVIGSHMRQIDPTFKPGQFGHSSLSKLVRACGAQYPRVFELREQAHNQLEVRLKG